MELKTKITILSLVFVLSTVFFWLAINEYLLPSRAQLGSNMQIVPHATDITCNPGGECFLHILGSVDPENAVAGVSGAILYGEGIQPVRLQKVGICADSSLGLDTELQNENNPSAQILRFSLGALKKNEDLKGGNGCITSFVFTADPQNTVNATKITLAENDRWQAGGLISGAVATFVPQVDTSTIAVTFDPNAPLPSVTPGPSGQPIPTVVSGTPVPSTTPAPGCQLEKGDCNCDSSINLVDWEILRSAVYQEGGVCDTNGDGQANALDVSTWIENNELVKPIIIQGQ